MGIFIDNEMNSVNRILLPITSVSDVFLLFYVKKILNNSNASVTILDSEGIVEANAEIKQEIKSIENTFPDKIKLQERKQWKEKNIKNYQLVALNVDGFEKFANELHPENKELPSFLLMRA